VAIYLFARRFAFLLPALLLAACAQLHMRVPMERMEYTDDGKKNTTLVIFLPGIYDRAGDFERQGLVKAVRDRALRVDMVAVEAHFGYYLAGSVIDRLHADIILPARKRGYNDIWLVGVSLGGFGSLLYSKAYPQEVKGMLLISPFLGYPAHSLDPVSWLESRNGEDGLWQWLADYPNQRGTGPVIYLAYGEKDTFADTGAQLAQYLLPENVIRLPGDHDWPTWKLLWDEALNSGLFSTPARPVLSEKRTGKPSIGVHSADLR
jgi:pimeloyl-ACP methyl ester carboxylesterase